MTEQDESQPTPAEAAAAAATTPAEHEEIKKAAKRHAAKKEKPKAKWPVGETVKINTGKDDTVVLPHDESDEHWDPKMRNPVPGSLVRGLAEFDWDPSMAAVAVERDGKLHLVHGKTRWRALEAANAARKKAGLGPVTAHVFVADESDAERIVYNMRRNTRLNSHVQAIDPMTRAESIIRALSAGVEEKQVAEDHGITVNDLHGHLVLTDEGRCPPAVQELVRSGQVSFAAALELARRAEKLSKGELTQAAEQVAKMANGGVRVTSREVKRAAGVQGASPATQKEKKQLVLELQKADLRGKHGDAAKWAAILAMEVGLGTRTLEDFWEALDKVAKGSGVRVDFKQYATEAPIKGQEK